MEAWVTVNQTSVWYGPDYNTLRKPDDADSILQQQLPDQPFGKCK